MVVNMKLLEDCLLKKRTAILNSWYKLIAETYPDDGSMLLKSKDRFTNPVSYITSTEIVTIFDELLHGNIESEKVSDSINNVTRVRAVQDFPPSQAVSFILLLKKAIRIVLLKEIQEKSLQEELLQIDSLIDRMSLMAFDVYTTCRDKICELRINELRADRDNAFRILERSGQNRGQ